MNLERELKQALQRVNPPEGFEGRVLGRIRSGRAAPQPVPPPIWRRLAIPLAASMVMAVAGGYYTWRHEERQLAAQQAAYDVALALRIASEKVSAVQTKVQEISRHDRQVSY